MYQSNTAISPRSLPDTKSYNKPLTLPTITVPVIIRKIPLPINILLKYTVLLARLCAV